MVDFTKVTACGEVVGRPDMSETEGGVPACRFWVKSTRRWTTRTGAQCEETVYAPCHGVGRVANVARKYVRSGVRVLIDGYLRVLTVPTETGVKETEMFIEVEHIAFLSPRAVAEACGKTW